MTRALTDSTMPRDLQKGLMRAFKQHLKGRRPGYDTVATAAFFVGYLVQLTEHDDLTPEALASLVHENLAAGSRAATELLNGAKGVRQ